MFQGSDVSSKYPYFLCSQVLDKSLWYLGHKICVSQGLTVYTYTYTLYLYLFFNLLFTRAHVFSCDNPCINNMGLLLVKNKQLKAKLYCLPCPVIAMSQD